MKSIYEIYIPVKDQEQANRLKAICLEYGLPISEKEKAFIYDEDEDCIFEFGILSEVFAIYYVFKFYQLDKSKESTEEEFINILKEMKK